MGGVLTTAQQKQIQLGTMRLQVQSLTSLSGLRISCFREPWCGSQTWLGSGLAVAMVEAGSCSPNETPSLGTSMCRGCSPKKKSKKQTKKESYRLCVREHPVIHANGRWIHSWFQKRLAFRRGWFRDKAPSKSLLTLCPQHSTSCSYLSLFLDVTKTLGSCVFKAWI